MTKNDNSIRILFDYLLQFGAKIIFVTINGKSKESRNLKKKPRKVSVARICSENSLDKS